MSESQLQKQSSDWSINTISPEYQTQAMTPKQLQRIMLILKNLQLQPRTQFGFMCQSDLERFQQIVEEERQEYYEEMKPIIKFSEEGEWKRKIKDTENLVRSAYLEFRTKLKVFIFMKAFKKEIQDLQVREKVTVLPYENQIWIKSAKTVGKGSVVFHQLLMMANKLEVAFFSHDTQLVRLVKNSKIFVEQLQRKGVFVYQLKKKQKFVAFYSIKLQSEQIRKIVNQKKLHKFIILNVENPQVKQRENKILFMLLKKSIKNDLQFLSKIYEVIIQANETKLCFVLHLHHDAFAKQPLQRLQKVFSQRFFFSFKSKNCRGFLNTLRKNSEKYPFITAKFCSNNIYLCVNYEKMTTKKDLIQVLSPFLKQLSENDKQKLTIYLTTNKVLCQNKLKVNERVSDLAQKHKLQLFDFSKFIEGKDIAEIGSPMKSQQAQTMIKRYASFFVQLLMQQDLEDEDLDTVYNNVFIYQAERRGGRGRGQGRGRGGDKKEEEKNESKVGKKEENEVKKQRGNMLRVEENKVESKKEVKKQIQDSENKEKVEKKAEETQKSVEIKLKKQKEQKQTAESNSLTNPKKAQTKPEPQKIKKFTESKEPSIYPPHSIIKVPYVRPQPINSNALFSKSDRDRQTQLIISTKTQIELRCYKIKVNYQKFCVQENQNSVQKEFAISTKQIGSSLGMPCTSLKPCNIATLDDQQQCFLAYPTPSGQYIPTHLLIIYK